MSDWKRLSYESVSNYTKIMSYSLLSVGNYHRSLTLHGNRTARPCGIRCPIGHPSHLPRQEFIQCRNIGACRGCDDIRVRSGTGEFLFSDLTRLCVHDGGVIRAVGGGYDYYSGACKSLKEVRVQEQIKRKYESTEVSRP